MHLYFFTNLNFPKLNYEGGKGVYVREKKRERDRVCVRDRKRREERERKKRERKKVRKKER